MSNDLVNYEDLLAGMAQGAAKLERPSGASIGTRAGVLTYAGSPVAGNKLDVIVVASVHTNTYYDQKYDPNNIANPVCFSYSESGEDMVPHPASSKPQHTDCATCPMNQWGSDPNGGRGKACKNGRALAVIPANTKPEDIATAEMAILRPPVTSIKNWQMYVQKVVALYRRPPLGVVTQIGTVPDQKSQFKVTFTDIGAVEADKIKGILDRVPEALTVCQKVYEGNAEETQAPSSGKKFKA